MQDAFKTVLTTLGSQAEKERRKKKSYQDLFKTTDGIDFRNMLRHLDHLMTSHVLDICQVIRDKTGKNVDSQLFDMLCSLPLVRRQIENSISKTDGPDSCIDKAFARMNEFVKQHLKEIKA